MLLGRVKIADISLNLLISPFCAPSNSNCIASGAPLLANASTNKALKIQNKS